uniref:Uncharacterized protein n=1 Tax=Anguilla anguilla TaxID=7936 RepID=A0A0E9WW21_ANGAN
MCIDDEEWTTDSRIIGHPLTQTYELSLQKASWLPSHLYPHNPPIICANSDHGVLMILSFYSIWMYPLACSGCGFTNTKSFRHLIFNSIFV